MTSPQGEPVNAVYGFTRDLLYLLEKKRPDFLFSAHDPPGPTFRHELFEPYKAQRGEMPDELRSQMPKIQEVLQRLGIPVISVPNFEADDVLATVARQAEALGGDCMVVTGDKDCRQLITDHVRIYNVRKDFFYDAAALNEEWGVRPDQVVDFQALVGDPVDNVPGVALIGPKVARELLEKYDTLEWDSGSCGRSQRPATPREPAGRARAGAVKPQACALDAHVPIELDWQQAEVRPARHGADVGAAASSSGFIALPINCAGRRRWWLLARERRPIIARSIRRRSSRSFWAGCWSSLISRSIWKPPASRRRRPISSAMRSVGPRAKPTICPSCSRRRSSARRASHAGCPAADSGEPADRQDRSEPEVRRLGVAAVGRAAVGNQVRHHGGQLSAGCRRA